MTGLVDGATVPWYAVSGKTEPDPTTEQRTALPPPVVRAAARDPLARAAAGLCNVDPTPVTKLGGEISLLGIAASTLGHAIATTLQRLKGDT